MWRCLLTSVAVAICTSSALGQKQGPTRVERSIIWQDEAKAEKSNVQFADGRAATRPTGKRTARRVRPASFHTPAPTPRRAFSFGKYFRHCDQCGYRWFGRRAQCWRCVWEAEPLGGSVHAAVSTQIAKGQRARLVLYRYDFENAPEKDQTKLNYYGRRRLRKLAELLQDSPYPLVIEALPNQPELAEGRRLHVIETLASEAEFEAGPDRVVVGDSPVPGLPGDEAMEIDRNVIDALRSQAISAGSGSFTPDSGFGGGVEQGTSTLR